MALLEVEDLEIAFPTFEGVIHAVNGISVKLEANERVKKESELYIEADTALPYGVVITAMAVAKNAGVSKVMMLTEAEDNLGAKLTDLDQNKPK